MQTQVNCPNCGTTYLADIYQIIDAGLEPQLKEMLLAGQLNIAVCPNCGVGGRIGTPLLYHDPAHDLFMVHVPQELNLDARRREELIGRLVKQAVDQTPPEKRRGYMLQPQTMLTIQSFMEKVWQTEGVTPEMLARQQRQVDLVRNLATSSPDVQDVLIEERIGDIDETFFQILRTQIDALSQTGESNQLVGLLNLQAKLMTGTEAGRKLEKQQIALHALSRDAKKAGGITPEILAKHVIANEGDDDLVTAIAISGQSALDYSFFTRLTDEVDKRQKAGDKAGAERLGRIRDNLLEMQREMQEASRQILQEAQDKLDRILAAPNTDEAVSSELDQIDDVFMHVLNARLAHAEAGGRREELSKLQQIQNTVIAQIEGETPPEVRLLSKLVNARDKKERNRLMEASPELITEQLVDVVNLLKDQAINSGQEDLSAKLEEIHSELTAKLMVAN